MRTTYAGVAVVAVLITVVVAGWLTPSAPAGSSLTGGTTRTSDPTPAGALRADAVVLVDSSSPDHGDFSRLIAPYLDHFGVPYSLVDVASGTHDVELAAYSLIVVGHRGVGGRRPTEASSMQALIERAVTHGTGLVSFDTEVWVDGAARYPLVQRALAFDPAPAAASRGVTFSPPGAVTTVDLSADAHQQPPLPTTTDLAALDDDDGKWTEYLLPARGFPAVMAAVDEFERHRLPPMRFGVSGLAPGRYDVMATVYTGAPGQDIRYYFGFNGEDPRHRHVDAVGGSGGTEEHTEYLIGQADVGQGGTFALTAQDADLLRGTYPVFGWARLRLVRAAPGAPPPHYLASAHARYERVPTAAMTLPGLRLRDETAAVAFSGDQPLLVAGTLGGGRVVQWTTYEWMRTDVRGPLGGLDDLVWRSFAWAARKPFVMQVLPPVLTMRMDDESGPLEWLHTAIAFGFKPWVGVFLAHIDDAEARELSALARTGAATVSVHSFDDRTFFYFDHAGRREWPTSTMTANLRRAQDWHRRYDIPPSTYVVPHYYEIGTNALPGVVAMGAEYLAVHMPPGRPYGAPWLEEGPFRRGVRGPSMSTASVYYNDVIDLPAPPGLQGRLHNCVTEIRDDAGYEWYPTPEVDVTVGRGIRQLRRALDSRAIATLFTHGYFIPPIGAESWRTILERITTAVADHAPLQMTMDAACALARGQQTSTIASAIYEPSGRRLRLRLTGHAEVATSFAVFENAGDGVAERTEWVPPFTSAVDHVASMATTPAPAPAATASPR